VNLKKSLLWLSLSLPIFLVDIIQRGFAAFAKAKDFMIPNMEQALGVYFITMSIGVLFCSIICDNFNSRKILLWSCIIGGIGMATLPFNYVAFGIIFGMAAAFIKISPFSATLKLKDTPPAMSVVPQAIAKNLAGALFILVLGVFFKSIGWVTSTSLLGLFFILSGIYIYFMVPDDKIEGWDWSIFKVIVKQFKFWHLMTYMFFMSGMYYLVVKQFYPEMVKVGISSNEAMTYMAISLLISGLLRFPYAWLGDIKAFGKHSRFILMWGGVIGMSLPLLTVASYPIPSLILYTLTNAVHTPTYWAYHKENWGPEYISTVASLGFAFMYLGSGVLYGSWTS
jgi:MFS family permease